MNNIIRKGLSFCITIIITGTAFLSPPLAFAESAAGVQPPADLTQPTVPADDAEPAPADPVTAPAAVPDIVGADEPLFFAAATHEVIFQDFDGTPIGDRQYIEEGSPAAAPLDPSRVGYTFTGWDLDFSNVTGPMTVTATYTANQYTVTFEPGSASSSAPAVRPVTYDAPLGALPDAPVVRTGKIFNGWFTAAAGGVKVSANEIYKTAGNTIYFAQYTDVKSKWFYQGGGWRYSNADGNLQTGWGLIDGKWYLFDSAGLMKSGLQTVAGKLYYFGAASDGAMKTGWRQADGNWYYFNAPNGDAVKGDWRLLDGKWYLFGGSGQMLTGLQTVGAGKAAKLYYFGGAGDGAMKTGWQHINKKWYYFNAPNGDAVKDDWKLVDGKWYLFDSSGQMLTGFKAVGSKNYYFDNTGAMYTGWKYLDNQWHYFAPDGHAAINQWQFVNGKWYSFDANGQMRPEASVKGFQKFDGKWYDLGADGTPALGWKSINAKWYYFSPPTGAGATEWAQIGASWYYFNSEAVMLSGWQTTASGTYYLGGADDGAMKIGKYAAPDPNDKIVKNFLFGTTGALQRNATVVIGGVRYTTDANGIVINEEYMGPVWKGIDVSYAQGHNINWAAVRASGVRFAIIRAGYTDWKGTYFQMDSDYVHNVQAAKAQGLAVGTYLYVYSRSTEELTQALNDFNVKTRSAGLTFDLPVFLDIEDDRFYLPATDALGGYDYRTNMLRAGLNQLRGQGYKPGFYASLSWANTKFNTRQLVNEGASFWLAHWYQNNSELNPEIAAWNGDYPSVWQYRSTGSVPGISGNVDMDYLYTGRIHW